MGCAKSTSSPIQPASAGIWQKALITAVWNLGSDAEHCTMLIALYKEANTSSTVECFEKAQALSRTNVQYWVRPS